MKLSIAVVICMLAAQLPAFAQDLADSALQGGLESQGELLAQSDDPAQVDQLLPTEHTEQGLGVWTDPNTGDVLIRGNLPADPDNPPELTDTPESSKITPEEKKPTQE